MSNKEKKNQAYNLLANEIRRLDYFKVFSDTNMLKIAYRIVNESKFRGVTESSTHYHATYVSPKWAPQLDLVGRIGTHIFYRWP